MNRLRVRIARPAAQTIVRESGRQFDPAVVDAFRSVEGRLRHTFADFALARDRDALGAASPPPIRRPAKAGPP